MLALRRQSLEWALNLAIQHGDTDIFPVAFEFLAIDNSLLDWLQKEDVMHWNVRPFRRCLTPKHRYGFRISTQLDPLDFLVYTALVYEIGEDLESRRVPATEKIVHSYRFNPQADGMYDSKYNYSTFRDAAREIADTNSYSHVVVADIADFFPRLYVHRVENALRAATTKTNHAIAISNLLSQWNEHYSYGIPVGPTASRLISEVTLDDIDKTLLSEGIEYVRFSDDFRIFCRSQREAHERLALLAYVLFENHGLTLQESKTRILHIDHFVEKYLTSEEATELKQLSQRFNEIVSDIQDDIYDEIKWEDLTTEQQKEIEGLNLVGILEEQVRSEGEIDISMCRFVLRRLAQTGNAEALDLILDNIDVFYAVFPHVVKYITALRTLAPKEKKFIGERILKVLDGTTVSHLEFHKMWLFSMFTLNTEWDNEDRFSMLYNNHSDQFSQREIILALGRSKQEHWFRRRKRNVFDFGPWQRRALIAAGSCLPIDERKHWYQSLDPRLDKLEKAVIRWARNNPF